MRLPFAITGLAVLALATGEPAAAQMYTNGPGLYMSLEGRSLQSTGDKSRDTTQSLQTDDKTDRFSDTSQNQNDWGGKAALDYRFQNNWDIGFSASGLKSTR